MLELLFRSRVMAKLLSFFLGNPEREAFLRELSRDIDEPASAVMRELARLEDFGLLVSRKDQKRKYFSVNPEFPLLPELRGLYLKTDGVVGLLRETLASLDGVQLAFIYGGFAESPKISTKRIDVAVVGNVGETSLAERIIEARAHLGREISYRHFQPDEFRRLIETEDQAPGTILSGEKIILVANIADQTD